VIVRQNGRVIVLGVVAGAAAALLTSHLLRSLLFGVAPNDLVTHAVTGTVLLAAPLTACWWPARRAAGLAPSDCLRAR